MKLSDQKGQAMVELALLLPLLLSLVFGITEFGRALYMKNTLVNAAREGARRASISPNVPLDIAELQTFIKACIPFDKTGLDIKISPTSPDPGRDAVTVTLDLKFQSIVLQLIPQLKDITLKGQASMLYE